MVTKDVPPYAIVAGNPARIVHMRFDSETIRRLLAVKWWGWDENRLQKAMPFLLSTDIETFLNGVDNNML